MESIGPTNESHDLQAASPHAEPISFVIKGRKSPLPERTRNPVYVLLLVAGLIGAASLAHYAAGLPGVIAAVVLLLAAILGVNFVKRRSIQPEPIDEARLKELPDARICITGHRENIGRFTHYRNVPFEPAVFDVLIAHASTLVTVLSGALLGVILMLLLNRWMPTRMTGGWMGGLYQTLGLLIMWLVSRIFPTYYRIVPGRLDVMRFSFLTNRARILQRHNLKSTPIFVDLPTGIVRFGRLPTDPMIRVSGVSEPYKFIEAILMGAVSTYPAPPVPDDRLIG